ncbi:hypothetical protein GOBAR_AA18767 [Gossypium barbadense]|uniref:Uncharacterized protein n=1 Tax=Gossypium barbadense TaxID=3634 RepID=A0A2P5XF32_GOSBA|nr:hypothetical protein GOBAR_AA18767 [Gossypium barbadense]
MAQREEQGWPLGLEPLNARIGLQKGRCEEAVGLDPLADSMPKWDHFGGPSCIYMKPALHFPLMNANVSTGSFFHDKSIPLGTLIGLSSFLELSSRSSTRQRTTQSSTNHNNGYKSRPWPFSFCPKLTTDAVYTNNKSRSLGHYLAVERRAATGNIGRRDRNSVGHKPVGDLSPVMLNTEQNSLFVNDRIAPRIDGRKSADRGLLEHGHGYGVPLLLSCLCRQLMK